MSKITNWIENDKNETINVNVNNESLTKILFSYQDPERKTKVLNNDQDKTVKLDDFNIKEENTSNKTKTIKFKQTSEIKESKYQKEEKKETSNIKKTKTIGNETIRILDENSCATKYFQPTTKEIEEFKPKKELELEQKPTNVENQELKKESKKDKFRKKYSVPSFIRIESKFSFMSMLFSLLIFSIGLSCLIATVYAYFKLNQSPYLFIPSSIFGFISLAYFSLNASRYNFFRKEIKLSDGEFDKENPLMSIKRIYKRLCIANFNLNWFCAIVYLWCILGIGMIYLISYFINLFQYTINDFGNLTVNGDITPFITVWSLASVCFVLFPLQVILNIFNRNRKFAIDAFYKTEIISLELQHQYKKSAKWKWIILLITSILLLTLPVIITYFVLKKKGTTAFKLFAK